MSLKAIDPELRRRIVSACGLRSVEGDEELRHRVIDTCRSMNAAGLNQGKSGNLSVRVGERCFLITPTGVSYDSLRPEDVVCMTFDETVMGRSAPSSEWRMHRDVLAARPEARAVLHAHPVRSTALACHGRAIPAFHYMVAVAGGADIRCAPYATFGTQALADGALEALEGRRACLLEHHGLLALGDGPEAALDLAIEVETLAAMYLEALSVGEPPVLPDDEMKRVLKAFAGYGQPR